MDFEHEPVGDRLQNGNGGGRSPRAHSSDPPIRAGASLVNCPIVSRRSSSAVPRQSWPREGEVFDEAAVGTAMFFSHEELVGRGDFGGTGCPDE